MQNLPEVNKDPTYITIVVDKTMLIGELWHDDPKEPFIKLRRPVVYYEDPDCDCDEIDEDGEIIHSNKPKLDASGYPTVSFDFEFYLPSIDEIVLFFRAGIIAMASPPIVLIKQYVRESAEMFEYDKQRFSPITSPPKKSEPDQDLPKSTRWRT